MFKVIGYQKKELKFKDGSTCPRYNVYLSEVRDGVNGVACYDGFISDKRLGTYLPAINDSVEVIWDRYKANKIGGLVKVKI